MRRPLYLLRSRLLHHRLGMRLGRLVVNRGLGLVMRGLMDRRGMMRLGRRCGLVVVMLGRRRRRRPVVRLVVRRRRRRGMMVAGAAIVDHIDFVCGDDAADQRHRHHARDECRNKTHRVSF
jgi:hypothetical protein